MNRLKRLVTFLSGPHLLHFVLPLVMVYLFLGTVAQRYVGLYEATQTYFVAPVLWVGGLPFPGFPILLALITFNLMFKLFFKSPWTRAHAGIIITHIGVLLLLIGGLFTALFSSEGSLDFAVGQSRDFVADYHEREFVVLNDVGEVVFRAQHEDLFAGQIVQTGLGDLEFEIVETCRHCKIEAREDAPEYYMSMAHHMRLVSDDLQHTDEENLSGVLFVAKTDGEQAGYVVLEDVPQLPEILVGEKAYTVELRKVHRGLPFSVTLLDFKRDVHAGTDLAKAYESHVLIEDGDLRWESVIRMNEPLRYKGYAFFQSSFLSTPQGDVSVLAVVWNVGRAFPYISGLLMCLGLIVHLIVRRRVTHN